MTPLHFSFLAGQLSAPEQSRRSVSKMLSRISDLEPESNASGHFSALLSSQVERESEQDGWFLQGGAIQIGVVPEKEDPLKGNLIHECLLARCLWESHWREEWCGLYERSLAFYAPLARKPSFEIACSDIQSLRLLDTARSPLPGYPLLVIETAWRLHYVAFSSEDTRLTFLLTLEDARSLLSKSADPALSSERELSKARFWLGFQSSVESSLSSGRGKWAEVASGRRMKRRIILNNRRMVFDLQPETKDANTFVGELLSTSLSFSLNSLAEHPESLVNFLDSTCQLRTISLHDIDPTNSSSFCSNGIGSMKPRPTSK